MLLHVLAHVDADQRLLRVEQITCQRLLIWYKSLNDESCSKVCKHVCCYAMLCYAMLCYAMLCYAMLCYAMLCYAMLCYAMLRYAMLCPAMPGDTSSEASPWPAPSCRRPWGPGT